MKRFIAIFICLAMAAAAFAQDGKRIYNKFSSEEGVDAVYISPAMMKMIGNIPELTVNEVDLAPVLKSMTGLYVIHVENSRSRAALRSEVDKLTGGGRFELLMEAKSDGDNVRMYASYKGDYVSCFVLFAEEAAECSFICIEGQISREDADKMLGSINR